MRSSFAGQSVFRWASYGTTTSAAGGTRKRPYRNWLIYGGPYNSVFLWQNAGTSADVVVPDVTPVVKTGTGGIDRRRIFKPTGLVERKRKVEPRVEERIEQAREIHAEIILSQRLDLLGSEQIEEIGRLLRKTQRTQDEEILLLVLMSV